jgi:hypothetical protein
VNPAKKELDKIKYNRNGYPMKATDSLEIGEALVEMEGVLVKYGSKAVLGNWT